MCQRGGDRILEKSQISVTEDLTTRSKHETPPFIDDTINYTERISCEKIYAESAKVKTKHKREETILEWFDRSMEDELTKRRDEGASPKIDIKGATGHGHALVMDSTISRIDMGATLRGERDTELFEAVDRFSKAEAIVAFEGAVKAAEEAAANAPPDLAEEAAVAGAKGFQAELTNVVKQKLPGSKPMEVVGYVGITRPTFAKKPECES